MGRKSVIVFLSLAVFLCTDRNRYLGLGLIAPDRIKLRQNSHMIAASSSSLPQNDNSYVRSKLGIILMKTLSMSVIISNSMIYDAYAVDTTENLKSDEISIDINSDYLGVSLKEIKYKNSVRVVVQQVKTNADATLQISGLKPGMIIVSIGGTVVEGSPGKSVVKLFKEASRPTRVVFRDPQKFFNLLNSSVATEASQGNGTLPSEVITTIVPGSEDRKEQLLRVERVEMPSTLCLRSAAPGDVLEIDYTLSGSSSKPRDSNLWAPRSEQGYFFVLGLDSGAGTGQSAFTGIPPGYDIALRGMCIGERRRIYLPSVLTDRTVSKRTVDAEDGQVLLDVKLLSINGITEL